MIAVLYAPFGRGGLPNNNAQGLILDYLTTFRTPDGDLQTYMVRPGLNLFDEEIPEPVLNWIKGLREHETISVFTTKATKVRATEFEPKRAVFIINALCGDIDVFMEGCTNPEVIAAAKKRTEKLRQVYGN